MTPESQPDHYTEVPETGIPVLYWPGGKVDHSATPLNGIIHKGWDQGQADINFFPDTDGSSMYQDGVFHIGDRRIFDSRGNISLAATRKGCWEPAPLAKAYIEKRIKALQGKKVAEPV